MKKTYTLADLASRLGLSFEGGDGECIISGVAGLREATAQDISFLSLNKYIGYLKNSHAAAIIVPKDFSLKCSSILIRSENPEADFTRVARLFAPPEIIYEPGIHPTAIIAKNAKIEEDVHIGPYTVIEPDVHIGAGTCLMAHTYIGHGCYIGRGCRFYPQVSLREYTEIGERVIIHNGTVLGSDGFGYHVDKVGIRTKIPQIGRVVIGNDVEIGANVTIDRARFGVTRIGNGVKIDNLVMIAHNVTIEDHAVLVSQTGVSGSVIIRKKAILAGQSGIVGHLEVGEGVIVAAKAGVTKDIPANSYVIGFPAIPFNKASRIKAHSARLPSYKRKIDELEERLQRLEQLSKDE